MAVPLPAPAVAASHDAVSTKAAPPPGSGGNLAATDISVSLSNARLLNLPSPVADVIVPNPEIIDVIIRSRTQAYLIAKKVGETNIFFVNKAGRVIQKFRVQVNVEIKGALDAIKTLIPGANIKLKGVKGTIVLNGSVRAPKQSSDAAAIARRFVDKDSDVINMLHIVADQQVLLKMQIAEVQRNAFRTLGATTSFSKQRGGEDFHLRFHRCRRRDRG